MLTFPLQVLLILFLGGLVNGPAAKTVQQVMNLNVDYAPAISELQARNKHNTPVETLRILQWNALSLHTNLDHFKQYIAGCKPDIIAVQSVGRKHAPVIPGYYYPPYLVRNKDAGDVVAVATYVRSHVKFGYQKAPVPDNHLAVMVEVETTLGAINVLNLYYPKGVSEGEQTAWISQLDGGKSWVVLGDFNAHHQLWGTRDTMVRNGGQHLAEHIELSPLVLLNDGTATRLPQVEGHRPTAIDLTLASAELEPLTSWIVENDDLGSDHLPIITTIMGVQADKLRENTDPVFNYGKANWGYFTELLSTPDFLREDMSVEEMYNAYRGAVLDAAQASIPYKTTKNNNLKGNVWWSEECQQAVRDKNKAYKKLCHYGNSQNLINYKKSKAECKQTIKKAKEKYWEDFILNNVDSYRDIGKVWQETKKIKHQYKPPAQPLIVDGVKITEDKAKAETFADIFARASQSESLPEDLRQHRQQWVKPPPPPPDRESPLNMPFSLTELKVAISNVKKPKKATGQDPVSYQMIRHFPDAFLQKLLTVFNQCWDEGIVPSQWNNATVTPLHKPGKPRSDPSGYRPISLTPHTGKIYERLVRQRLDYHLAKNKTIPNIQAGFRKARSCTDHLVRLTAHVKRNLLRNRPTALVCFDVKKAYDSVWLDKLMWKLGSIGLNGNILSAIQALTHNRTIQVKVKGECSSLRRLDIGLPQGSILSPILYNVMLMDLNKDKLQHCQIGIYADDIALWYTPDVRRLTKLRACQMLRKGLQRDVTILSNYMKENGFQFSAEKTAFVVFRGPRTQILRHELFIIVNGARIETVDKVKYLGVTLDCFLSFRPHAHEAIAKTRKVWNLVKVLNATPGCNSQKHLLEVVRALVRSRLSYGQEVYFTMSNTMLNKLASTECNFLRFVLGCARGTPQEQVYRLAGWLPLGAETQLRCAQFQTRAQVTDNPVTEVLQESFCDPQSAEFRRISEKRPSWVIRNAAIYQYTEPLMREADVIHKKVVKMPEPDLPPWVVPDIHTDYAYTHITKNTAPAQLASEAKIRLDTEYSDYLRFFTDGSKQEGGNVGCAWTCPQLDITNTFRLNQDTSIVTAELYALVKVMDFLVASPYLHEKIVVVTDSKSSLQELHSANPSRSELVLRLKTLVHQLQHTHPGIQVAFLWVPGHSGIAGNESADKAAKQAANKPAVDVDLLYTKSEINKVLKRTAMLRWERQYKQKATERHWNLGFSDNPICPPLNKRHAQVFNRLRCGKLRTHYWQPKCMCQREKLSVDHIFTCRTLLAAMPELTEQLNFYQQSYCRESVFIPHIQAGWSLVHLFIKCLLKTEVALYI